MSRVVLGGLVWVRSVPAIVGDAWMLLVFFSCCCWEAGLYSTIWGRLPGKCETDNWVSLEAKSRGGVVPHSHRTIISQAPYNNNNNNFPRVDDRTQGNSDNTSTNLLAWPLIHHFDNWVQQEAKSRGVLCHTLTGL